MKNLKKISRQDLKNVRGAANTILPFTGCEVRCVCTSTVDGSPFIGICDSRTGLCCSA